MVTIPPVPERAEHFKGYKLDPHGQTIQPFGRKPGAQGLSAVSTTITLRVPFDILQPCHITGTPLRCIGTIARTRGVITSSSWPYPYEIVRDVDQHGVALNARWPQSWRRTGTHCHHFIPLRILRGPEREMQGIGPTIHANRISCPNKSGKLIPELPQFIAKNQISLFGRRSEQPP